jgi:hypothetical protein
MIEREDADTDGRGHLQHAAAWNIVVELVGLAGAGGRANDAHHGAARA